MASGARQVLCPGNIKFVSIGDTVKQVLQVCGTPLEHYEKTVDPSKSATQSGPLHWYYSNAYAGNNLTKNKVVNFSNGRVTSIDNGNSRVNSLSCRGGVVQVGDSMAVVSQRCGLPQAQASNNDLQNIGSRLGPRISGQVRQDRVSTLSDVQSFGKDGTKSRTQVKGKHNLLVLIYQPQNYLPKTAFMFIDGKLVSTGPVKKP
jgi:hypothetical protein